MRTIMGIRAGRNHATPPNAPLMRFIETLGVMWESYGLPPGAGRIFGLLLVADRPLTGEDISRTLRVSRSSVSTDIRGLLTLGVVERMRVPGNRSGYYVFSPQAWEHALTIRRSEALRYRDLAEQTMGALAPGHPGRKRLQELKEWADYFTEALNRIGAQWVARRNRVKEGRR